MSVQGQGDTAGWRRYVKPLLPPRTAGEAAAPSGGPGLTHPAPGQADVAPTARTQLGLQFELRELVPRSSENWNGPLSQAVKAGRRTVSGEYRLGVRPALRTERGWARASLTWANIGHHGARRGLEESQQRWFRQLHALHRAAEAITFGQDPDWIFLDDFLSPALWAMLAQADELGIALVGQSGRTPVRLHAAAELRLEVAAGPDDGLVLTPVLRIDGEPARLGGGGAIGTHGLYLLPDGSPAGAGAERVVTLAPVPDGLSQAEIALISAAQAAPPVVVPGAERQNFLREGVAELRTAFTLESADGSLVVPEPDPALIVLRAAWRSGHRLDLGWTHEGASGAYEPALAELLPPELVGVERIPEPWLEDLLPAGLELRGVDAAAFLANVVPALQLLPGIEVRISGAPPAYAELHGVPHLKVTTLPSEQADWFDLGVLVTVGEKTVPFGPLFRALAQGKKKLLLVDHTFLSLTHPSLQPLAELIAEAADLDEWQTGIRLHRHQVALWSEFEDLADESNAAVEWRQLVREVGAERPDPVAIPEGLTAELRDYQREGFHWLAFLWRNRLGGILADDMGLGKTLQCLALIAHAREGDATLPPFLVVAPTSVMSNWAAEAARFAPGLRVRVRTATAASSGRSVEADAREADIVVTSYALFRLDAEQYRAVAADPALGFAGLILDEAQFVKNGASRGNELATEIPIRWKLAVTGTPIENSLRELHALCRIVAPGLFPSARRFEEEYVRSIERPAP
ncbi:DEAD/DEAH box helicase, partial [Leucobacter sp. BZR 635]